jgi:hypothetical protein
LNLHCGTGRKDTGIWLIRLIIISAKVINAVTKMEMEREGKHWLYVKEEFLAYFTVIGIPDTYWGISLLRDGDNS